MKYILFCLVLTFICCSGNNAQQKESTSDSPAVSKKQSCLAEITDPAKWYSLKEVAALVNVPEETIKQSANESFHALQFNWKTERSHFVKLGRNTISITIKNLDEAIEKATRMFKGKKTFTYEEYFANYHSQITAEDKEKLNEQVDKKAEEEGNDDVKTAKKILALVDTQDYSNISGLGEDANKYVQVAPNLRETRLAVLHGNVVVLVNVDISNDDTQDLDVAKTIAEAVLGLCD